MMMLDEQQLSFEVLANPNVAPGNLIFGTLKIGGDLRVDRNLNRGDRITVQIADADGNILTVGVATVQGVGFVDVHDRETVIGTERQHKAKLA